MATREVLATLGFDVEAESLEKFDKMVTNSKKEMNRLVGASQELAQKQERLRKLTDRRAILETKVANNLFDRHRLEIEHADTVAKGYALREKRLKALRAWQDKLANGSEAEQKAAQENYEAQVESIRRLSKAQRAQVSQLNKLDAANDSLQDQLKANAFETKKAKYQVEKLNEEMAQSKKAAEGIEAAERQLKKLEKRAKQTEKAISMVDSVMSGMKTMFYGVTAGMVAGATALGVYTAQTAEFAEESVRSAEALGGSIDDYQKYRFAFKALGASQDDLMDAFATVTDRAVDAIEGSKTYAKEFTRIGIAVKDLKGKKPIELFEMFTTAAAKAKDKTQVLTSAVRLFGDDLGRRIMPALVGSSESFNTFLRIAEDSGVVLGEDLTRQAYKARFSIRLLTATGEGLAKKFTAKLLPTIGRAADKMLKWVANMQSMKYVTRAMDFVVDRIIGQFLSWQKIVSRVTEALGPGGIVTAVKVVTVAVTALGSAMAAALTFKGISTFVTMLGGGVVLLKLAAVIAVVSAAVGGLILLLGDLRGYFMGDNSVFGLLAQKFPAVKKALDALGERLPQIRNALYRLKAAFESAFETLTKEDREKMLEWFAVKFVEGLTKAADRLIVLIDSATLFVYVAAEIVDALRELDRWLDRVGDKLGIVADAFNFAGKTALTSAIPGSAAFMYGDDAVSGMKSVFQGSRDLNDRIDARNLMRGSNGLSEDDARAQIAMRRAIMEGRAGNSSSSATTITTEVNVNGVPGADAAGQQAFGKTVAEANNRQIFNALRSGER